MLSSALVTLLALSGRPVALGAASGRVPVLVELFTSEGCSSCPPADELLGRLVAEQPVDGAEIIALSEHVDYWNRLGWADPFSSPSATARQRQYIEAFELDSAYTPQMVVAGRWQFTGSRGREALAAVANAARVPQGKVALGWKRDTSAPRLEVRIDDLPPPSGPGDVVDVLLAVTESDLVSAVERGENAGSDLHHTAVVRDMRRLGAAQGGAFRGEAAPAIDPRWRRENLRLVVFAQERQSRRVVAVGAIPIGAHIDSPAAT